jgi:hypothetical protein
MARTTPNLCGAAPLHILRRGYFFSEWYSPGYPYLCPETVLHRRRKFDTARARRMEEMEREEQIELAIVRLSRMGLPITSVEQRHRHNPILTLLA